jgi:hypothetical protein
MLKILSIIIILIFSSIFANTDSFFLIQNNTNSSQYIENKEPSNNYKKDTEDIYYKASKKSFVYEEMNCKLEVPISWNLDTSSANNRVMTYPYNNDPILITLKTYVSSHSEITANTVYLSRSGSNWDRWHLLGSKIHNPKECFLIGVDERMSGIYRKQEMNERLELSTTIVAEDIFIKKPNIVYIITARAPESTWKKHSHAIREIMGSFYVEDRDGKKL